MFSSISPDALTTITSFLHPRDFYHFAPTCHAAAESCKLQRSKLISREIKDMDWIPDDMPERLIYPDPLVSWLRPMYNLRKLEMVGCRVKASDLREALIQVSHTLEELRLEMIFIAYFHQDSSTGTTASATNTMIGDVITANGISLPSPGTATATTTATSNIFNHVGLNGLRTTLSSSSGYPFIALQQQLINSLDNNTNTTNTLQQLQLQQQRIFLDHSLEGGSTALPLTSTSLASPAKTTTQDTQMTNTQSSLTDGDDFMILDGGIYHNNNNNPIITATTTTTANSSSTLLPNTTTTTTTTTNPKTTWEEEMTVTLHVLQRLEISPPLKGLTIHAPLLRHVSSFRKMLEDVCTTCRSPRPDFKCSKCKFYAYCSQACQSHDWSRHNRGHRIVCRTDENYARDIVGIVEHACESPYLRVLDIAHFWQRELLFKSALENGSDDEQNQQIGGGAASQSNGVPLFSRQIVMNTLPRLTSLRLLRCGLDDGVLGTISSTMPQLMALDISLNSKVTDDGLACLHICTNMKDLRIRQNYRITDGGIRALNCLTQLTFLDACCGARRSIPNNPHLVGHGQADAIKFVWTPSLSTILHLANSCQQLRTLRILRSSDTEIVLPLVISKRLTVYQFAIKEFHEMKDILGEPWPNLLLLDGGM
jgi:hypothetical protein